MAGRKRSRPEQDDQENSDSSFSVVQAEDDDIDISSALAGKHARNELSDIQDHATDDEELQEFINDSIAKRNMKGGTALLKKTKSKGKAQGEVGGGSFQSMGLHPSLLRALTIQGYRTPTPIQRATIPSLLASPPRDVVGMARTGSGKTLAYMVPLLQRLGGRHSHAFGVRAIILVPARELALQVLKVGKGLIKGWRDDGGHHAGDGIDNEDVAKVDRGETLRWGLVVGGESMDEQFEMISSNPDVIIATPGRLLHLIVEMNLSLTKAEYVVFDEADRLFELGFSTALTEILARLSTSRQTLLFSATLPKSLVEFAKAGLQNPKLVRLDAESKISTDLRMAFFSVKQAEKDACLLSLLRDVIKVPLGHSHGTPGDDQDKDIKGKGKAKPKYSMQTAPHQTLVFAATKHHVEYLTALLTTAGYAVSSLYGSLVQSSRTYQMSQFLAQRTQILVVTDVAARGLDIPILEHVVNYDFPVGARVFVHRVGRTARAGRRGWAWSFVTHSEAAYLSDLQLFLGRPLLNTNSHPPAACTSEVPYTQSLILGPFSRDTIDVEVEYIRSLDNTQSNLASLRGVMERGQSMYERSRGKASAASYKRAKELTKCGGGWATNADRAHPVLAFMQHALEDNTENNFGDERLLEEKRLSIVRAVNSFTPTETVFETGTRGKANAETVAMMRERRKALAKVAKRKRLSSATAEESVANDDNHTMENDNVDMEMADEEDVAVVFGASSQKGRNSFRDDGFYLSHYQKDSHTEKGYSLADGASSFTAQAHGASFDLSGDVAVAERQRHKLTWDKKKKNFVKGDGAGADNIKLVRTENGTRLPATYRSGRFEEWQKKAKVTLPKVGEQELRKKDGLGGLSGKRWKHNKVNEAKPLDRLHKDYERKARQLKKKVEEVGAVEGNVRGPDKLSSDTRTKKLGRRRDGKSIGRLKSELKTVEQIHKTRKMTEKKRAKNARPSRKGRR
ncbi:P-loop containing nucleoside triphosphate hydrolase protein [Pisolithus marmoratus]|nr:P-loop containing nucleoside triphosphate hydrolase protein [Pisolithus marmoratus]